MEQKLDLGFKVNSVSQDIQKAPERRVERIENALSFGVRYLDLALGGIWSTDCLLIGAKTGAGKTELAISIAAHNALRCKKVLMLALEAEQGEVGERLLYRRLISRMKDPDDQEITYPIEGVFNFMDWSLGKFKSIESVEAKISQEVGELYKNFDVYYRGLERFGLDELKKVLLENCKNYDLIIIDHIHYLDILSDNENRELTDCISTIRNICQVNRKPVIVVGHIRKGDSRSKQLVPDLEDFHGTSNLGKIATKSVMLGACHDQSYMQTNKWPTYLRVSKCRRDGSRVRYTAIVQFDTVQNAYESKFIPGRLEKDGTEFVQIAHNDVPYWARSDR